MWVVLKRGVGLTPQKSDTGTPGAADDVAAVTQSRPDEIEVDAADLTRDGAGGIDDTEDDDDDDVKRFAPHGLKSTPALSLSGVEARARVVSLHDGDTMTVVIEAFGGFYKYHMRLDGIDACELGAERPPNRRLALAARNRVAQLVTRSSDPPPAKQADLEADLDRVVRLVTVKCGQYDKYGRLLGRVFIGASSGPGAVSVNQTLLHERLVYEYHGGRRLTEEEQLRAMGRDKDGNVVDDYGDGYGDATLWGRIKEGFWGVL